MLLPSGLGLRQKTLLRVPRYSTQVDRQHNNTHVFVRTCYPNLLDLRPEFWLKSGVSVRKKKKNTAQAVVDSLNLTPAHGLESWYMASMSRYDMGAHSTSADSPST